MTNFYAANTPFTVTLTVTPANSMNLFAVVDQFPVGWTVTNLVGSLGDAAVVDNVNSEIKLGPVFDNSPETFTYQITPPANANGTANFVGTAFFDGTGLPITTIPITGVRQVVSSMPPPIFQHLIQTNGVLTLNWSAVPGLNYQLQYSTNLSKTNWFNLGSLVSATNSSISVSDSKTNTQRFYRVVLQP